MTKPPLIFLTVAALALSLNACAGIREPDLYVLTPPVSNQSISGPAQTDLLTLTVPDYLDTTDIVLRNGPHQLAVRGTARWAERLSTGVSRALAASLEARTASTMIVLSGDSTQPLRHIIVDIDTLDLWPDGRCSLSAHWSVLGADGQMIVARETGTFVTPAAPGVASDGALVSAVTLVVDQLAGRIAKTLPSNS